MCNEDELLLFHIFSSYWVISAGYKGFSKHSSLFVPQLSINLQTVPHVLKMATFCSSRCMSLFSLSCSMLLCYCNGATPVVEIIMGALITYSAPHCDFSSLALVFPISFVPQYQLSLHTALLIQSFNKTSRLLHRSIHWVSICPSKQCTRRLAVFYPIYICNTGYYYSYWILEQEGIL